MTFKEIVIEYYGTMIEFGKFLGVHRITVSKYYYDPRLLSADHIMKISEHTGLASEVIMEAIVNQTENNKLLRQ
jgi:hypothetical protein